MNTELKFCSLCGSLKNDPNDIDSTLSDVKYIKALENAVKGRCFCCLNARPPKSDLLSLLDKFPLMISCEHMPKVIAASSQSQKACKYWSFDIERFKDVNAGS